MTRFTFSTKFLESGTCVILNARLHSGQHIPRAQGLPCWTVQFLEQSLACGKFFWTELAPRSLLPCAWHMEVGSSPEPLAPENKTSTGAALAPEREGLGFKFQLSGPFM